MNYDEKLNRLSSEDFFTFFSLLKAEPRWVNSAGKPSIQLLGICHHGHHHSVVFDPTTLKITCFSECGGGMLFHTFVKRALDLDSPQDAKDFIEDWIDGQEIDFDKRVSRNLEEFEYQDRPFVLEDVPPVPGIGKEVEEELFDNFDISSDTLSRLVWHTKDGIDVEQLSRFNVAYYPKHKTIILPHHNINGEIVGLYERSFLPLRKQMKDEYPEATYKWLCQFPRAKYVPLLKEGHFAEEDEKKTSWSFPNIQNLYGLHLAKDAIEKTGRALVFEGAKSVMLAHQYGYPYAVATHTFGINPKQIAMLINCGAKEIYLAFDKQYQVVDSDDRQWQLYEKKTKTLAKKVGQYVDVYRIVDYYEDDKEQLLGYKDAPIDCGKKVFDKLFDQREPLIIGGELQEDRKRLELLTEEQRLLEKLRRPKVQHDSEPKKVGKDEQRL